MNNLKNDNIVILQELYFGKNIFTDFFDSAFQCLKEFLVNKNNENGEYILNDLISQFYPIIKKYQNIRNYYMTKHNYSNKYEKSYLDNINKYMHDKHIIIENQFGINQNNINKITIFISWLFKIIFGYNEVYILYISPKDQYHVSPSTYPLINFLHITDKDIDGAIKVEDDFGRNLSYNYITKSIDVQKEGIHIRWEQFALSMFLLIPINIVRILTNKEMTACYLHEIGHTFSKLLTPHVNLEITSRQDEKFADKFVTIYGYGEELVSTFSKIEAIDHLKTYIEVKKTNNAIRYSKDIADHIYSKNYKNTKTGLTDSQAKKYLKHLNRIKLHWEMELNNNNLSEADIKMIKLKLNRIYNLIDDVKEKKIDNHPLYYLRMIEQLQQLSIELKSNCNTNKDKTQILNDIQRIKNLINKYKNSNINDPFFASFDYEFDEINSEVKRQIFDDIKNMNIEKRENHNNKLDSRLMSSLLDNMYLKTNKDYFMAEIFKQFMNSFLDTKSNKYYNTKLFESYLILKYPKKMNEKIIDYCKRIISIKLRELSFTLEQNIKDIKDMLEFMKKNKSHDITDAEINNMIYNYIKQEIDCTLDLFNPSIDEINEIKKFNIFTSDCTFDSDDLVKEIIYDPDEIERIRRLYEQYRKLN